MVCQRIIEVFLLELRERVIGHNIGIIHPGLPREGMQKLLATEDTGTVSVLPDEDFNHEVTLQNVLSLAFPI